MTSLRYLLLLLTFSVASHASEPSLSCPQEKLQNIEAQYLFVGENHTDYNPISFFEFLLPELKKQGFEYFFAEYLDSNDQLYINRYQVNPHQETQLFQKLISTWGYDYFKYLDITQAVLSSGLKLIGLDRRHDLRNMFPGGKWMAIRDKHMYRLAQDFILENPDAKVIFFNGSSHSFENRHLEAPSFYEHFINAYGKEKTLNLKFDYFGSSQISSERLYLHHKHPGKISLQCKSKSFLLEIPSSSFDLYIFPDNQEAFPPDASGGGITI